MAEMKNYLSHVLDNGNVLISADVISSIAAMAVREVEGVYGLTLGSRVDLSGILNKTNLRKGIRVEVVNNALSISCNLIVMAGENVMVVAKNVQSAISSEVEAMTGVHPQAVHVTVCGIAIPKQK